MLRALKFAEKPDPTLYDHLGDIHAALGEPDQAREAWRKSLELEPNDAIRKKLESAAPK
jgi:Flp pilus assembly protein TadD